VQILCQNDVNEYLTAPLYSRTLWRYRNCIIIIIIISTYSRCDTYFFLNIPWKFCI